MINKEIALAWLNGADVEWRLPTWGASSIWHRCNNVKDSMDSPGFSSEYEWRIVPKQPEYRLCRYKQGYVGLCVRNCTYPSNNYSPEYDEQLLNKTQKDVNDGVASWLTEWLPLPIKE